MPANRLFWPPSRHARPKIADYPFTTLYPSLGVVLSGGTEFVLADIPGLIEGAHQGVGLGTRFLGHIERCRVLIHLIDGTQADVAGAYRTVRDELLAYGGGLAAKAEILVLNKIDALSAEEIETGRAALAGATGGEVLVASGVAGSGIDVVLTRVLDQLRRIATRSPRRRGWRIGPHRLQTGLDRP